MRPPPSAAMSRARSTEVLGVGDGVGVVGIGHQRSRGLERHANGPDVRDVGPRLNLDLHLVVA